MTQPDDSIMGVIVVVVVVVVVEGDPPIVDRLHGRMCIIMAWEGEEGE